MQNEPAPEAAAEDLLDDAPAEIMPQASPPPGPRLFSRPRAQVAGAVLALALALVAGWAMGRGGDSDSLPSPAAPARAQAAPAPALPPASSADVLPLPVADGARKERNRFTRADRDDDGWVQQSEYLAARRRNYDKLDANRDGRLDFAEYAASGIAKFAAADDDRSGALSAAEFADTAPKQRPRRAAPCPAPAGSDEQGTV